MIQCSHCHTTTPPQHRVAVPTVLTDSQMEEESTFLSWWQQCIAGRSILHCSPVEMRNPFDESRSVAEFVSVRPVIN